MSGCTLCPRRCGADRGKAGGFCRADETVRVAKAYLHPYEEPCLSGERGSGTVFFCGCNLQCVFCQNAAISGDPTVGRAVTVDRLSDIFRRLEAAGAHNINLVTPTIYADNIAAAIRRSGVSIPFVYNCGGYESVDTLRSLEGCIAVYMPDVKFFSPASAARYCRAPDYFDRAVEALAEMLRQTGAPRRDENGILTRGTLVRHLVMPGLYKDSIAILDALAARFGVDRFLLSLMSQYVPLGRAADFPEINRRVTTFEYRRVTDHAAAPGFDGFTQDRASATPAFIPAFDFAGVDEA